MGVLNLQVQNQGLLLLEFLHKFPHKEDVPWVWLIRNKYYL